MSDAGSHSNRSEYDPSHNYVNLTPNHQLYDPSHIPPSAQPSPNTDLVRLETNIKSMDHLSLSDHLARLDALRHRLTGRFFRGTKLLD